MEAAPPRSIDGLAVAAGLLGLGALAWTIQTRSYDIWGGYVLLPILGLLGTLGLRRMFAGELQPLFPIMVAGLLAKFVGAGFRYWVGYDVYDGVIDAQGYHGYASGKVSALRSGEMPLSELIPTGQGTEFLENVTAVLYYVGGTSRLGGFFLFSFIAFWGVAFFVRAAAVAAPELALRRYAVLCALAPSLVYWPSSIGKDAWMVFTLGIATYGVASLFARRGALIGVALAALGLLGAAAVRPHLAVIWLAALVPALLLGALLPRGAGGGDGRDTSSGTSAGQRVLLLGAVALAVVGLAAAAGATVRYLNPNDEDAGTTEAVTSILDEATQRTSQQGSEFTPPNTGNPANWPVAIVRTLTRPLIFEANGLAQLIAAAEMSAFLALCALSWRRLVNLPRVALRNRYLTFGMGVVTLGGLAFASFANLGVLTRQKSILFPFLLLILCVPAVPRRRRGADDADPVVLGGSSPAESADERAELVGASARSRSRDVWELERGGQLPDGRAHDESVWDLPQRPAPAHGGSVWDRSRERSPAQHVPSASAASVWDQPAGRGPARHDRPDPWSRD